MTMLEAGRALRVAIVGAGIGGLTAAAALRKMGGFDVSIYERSPELGEVGAGLQIGPNAVKVIRALGLEDRFMQLAAEPESRVTLKWDDGTEISREPFKGRMHSAFGAGYQMAHRADVHKLLLSLVPPESIQAGTECIDVQNGKDVVALRMANGQEIEADVVLGADGIHSVVRTAVFGKTRARFTNQICWRLVLPMEEIHKAADKLPGSFDGSQYTGWLGPRGHVICYPIRGGELLNIFAGRVSDQWTGEKWAVPGPVDEMLEAYAGWHPGLLYLLSRATEVFKWGIHDHDPLGAWVSGRIALLGDAAHPMMPTLAQGAAISIEDGYAIARHLDARRADPVAALAQYERARLPRATRVQLQARQQFLNNQQTPPPPFLPTDWIYGYDVVTSPLGSSEA
jgi:salicylate hydroxylase